ncbi:MAG: 50S ribosomal protein L34e [Nanoarchaeota archaeon]
MPKGREKSGRFRKVAKRTPGGRVTMTYQKRLPGNARCARCKQKLPGIPRMLTVTARGLAKTKKRPERPFGGKLCSSCMRDEIKKKH